MGRSRAPGAVRGGIARDGHTVLFGGAARRRSAFGLLVLALLLVAATALALTPSDAEAPAPGRPPVAQIGPAPAHPVDDGRGTADVVYPVIRWRVSRPVGLPFDGRLARGVRLPASGPDWFSWSHVRDRVGNPGWRRWGTDGLLRTLLAVLREYRTAQPGAPRVAIGDLSRHRGGPFGANFGGLGHSSHQNGLDADVYYPRRDGRERAPLRPEQVDVERAQALVNRFVRAGAEKVFVGPSLDLRGPRNVVIPLIHHDDHLHVRMPPPPD